MQARHVAEVLAGMTDDAADRRGRLADGSHLARLQGERQGRARRPAAAEGARPRPRRLHRASGARRSRRCPSSRRCATAARDIKNHTLAHLDLYLEAYEEKVREAGGEVHCAETAEEARDVILGICRGPARKTVTKGKSMIAEEIGLNDHLEANGIEPVETDLGEYIIQLRHEPPSHIIAPAVHLTKDQVEADFRRVAHAICRRAATSPSRRRCSARRAAMLRERFLAADVGITGANFLVAETGTSIIVTNEGNGDLTQILPRVHIVLASIEKIVPTLEDVSQILRLLARSATGQDMSVYTTFSTGPRRPGDPDGPERIPRRHPRQRPLGDARHASSRTCCAASAAAPA